MEQLNIVLEWIECGDAPDDFDDSFVQSAKRSYDKYGRLTSGQLDGLVNIIVGYKIGDT